MRKLLLMYPTETPALVHPSFLKGLLSDPFQQDADDGQAKIICDSAMGPIRTVVSNVFLHKGESHIAGFQAPGLKWLAEVRERRERRAKAVWIISVWSKGGGFCFALDVL